jgi:hypothetical protein
MAGAKHDIAGRVLGGGLDWPSQKTDSAIEMLELLCQLEASTMR